MLQDGLKKFVAKHLFIHLFSVLSNEKERELTKERPCGGDHSDMEPLIFCLWYKQISDLSMLVLMCVVLQSTHIHTCTQEAV